MKVKAAGKKTDADTSDRTLSASGEFSNVQFVNSGPSELRICIDGDSTSGTNQIIYIEAGESFADAISGKIIHYSVASGTATFRYVLK